MIFENLWPLFFLAAVPIIIILYLLKPKGPDYDISSNLLWKKLLKNEQSKTFFEKFVHNILMYLQILIVILLVIGLMAPFIRTTAQGGGRKILLLDASGSMQHENAGGQSRFEEAVEQACDYVRTMKNTHFSILVADGSEVNLLAVDSTDEDGLVRLLQGLTCSDGGDNLVAAQSFLDTLAGTTSEETAQLVVFTDANGAESYEALQNVAEKELHVIGEPVSNLANDYMVFTQREDGLYDVIVSVTNYSDVEASCEISLYEGEELLTVAGIHIEPSENKNYLIEGVNWQGEKLTSKLSGFAFAEGQKDSLPADNISYCVKSKGDLVKGLLVGEGNTFLEKAYQAVTGATLVKSTVDDSLEAGAYNVVIYDAGEIPFTEGANRLIFGNAYNSATEELSNVVLNIQDCDLTTGLTDFTIGVNKAYCFTPPENAVPFLVYDGKTVGYYLDRENTREVIVGFDVRESDFPLRAEFPVFLANALLYLSDSSWLATNVYYAGEELVLQPWAKPEEAQGTGFLKRAGYYEIGNQEYTEGYVVRFLTSTESDGRKTAESVILTEDLKVQKVKQTLRNIFILTALLLLLLEWILYVRQMRYKGKFYLVVRCVILGCLVLALLGLQIPVGSNKTATVFVVDVSNSNEANLDAARAYLNDTIEQMPRGHSFGIVTFGKNAQVEQFVTADKTYGGLLTTPEKGATNFEEAISKALSMIPENTNGRLVILTDGKETKGDIQRMGQVIQSSRTELLTMLYETAEKTDAYIEKVTLPSYLHPGDKYSINVVVESNYETDAVISIYNGSNENSQNPVHLNKGSNHFVFSEQVSPEFDGNALESLQIVVNAEGDTCQENNRYSAFSVIEAAPKILVISDRNTDVTGFAAVLQAAGCDYSMVSALNAPTTIQEMLAYKSIFLVDTYIDELPTGFLENLESYVKDYGCGFVCCGGEDSFALGGYRDTVLETILPVKMELRNINEAPSMAMVMVIDHSGSMMGDVQGKGSNLDLAIKAATVAVDNLQDKDFVGVLTFDDGYEWQVELTSAEDRTEIKKEIKKIEAGGGTTIKPAIQEAFRVISGSDAAVKHVILLTDGMGETTNYDDVIKAFSDSEVTLSTVAVGEGSDTKLLEALAKGCGGRYYYSDLSSDIPKIFAQEVFLGGGSFIQNGNFSLAVRSSHELTQGLFKDGWPYVYGYIAASPKVTSSTIIQSVEREEPILTTWQYGLGRTVAWNSDVTNEWTGGFAGKEDYVQLWKRIVDYSTGNADMGEDRVDVVTAGDITEIVYEAKDYDSTTSIYTTMLDPKGNPVEVKLFATAPGKFKAEIPTEQTGMYHFNIRREKAGEIQSYMTTAAAVQFSDEYKFDISTDKYLKFVDAYGRIITEEDMIWKKVQNAAGGKRDLTNYLLALAVFLFLTDVAMRRFQYVPQIRGLKRTSMPEKGKPEKTDSEVLSTQEQFAETITTEPVKVEKQKEKAVKKKKKETASETALDTSQLLKKKDDRNI